MINGGFVLASRHEWLHEGTNRHEITHAYVLEKSKTPRVVSFYRYGRIIYFILWHFLKKKKKKVYINREIFKTFPKASCIFMIFIEIDNTFNAV